jgi:hypothetical protein
LWRDSAACGNPARGDRSGALHWADVPDGTQLVSGDVAEQSGHKDRFSEETKYSLRRGLSFGLFGTALCHGPQSLRRLQEDRWLPIPCAECKLMRRRRQPRPATPARRTTSARRLVLTSFGRTRRDTRRRRQRRSSPRSARTRQLSALAFHALLTGKLTFARGLERSVANLDLALSFVMAHDQGYEFVSGRPKYFGTPLQ